MYIKNLLSIYQKGGPEEINFFFLIFFLFFTVLAKRLLLTFDFYFIEALSIDSHNRRNRQERILIY